MTRWLLALLLLCSGFALASPAQGSTAVDGVTISGGDLPHAVSLTAADGDAFKRRINEPPRLEHRPPRATGATYTLTTGYWSEILARPGRPPAADAATYYPEGGVAVTKVGEQDTWLALDLRQQGILERYIRLTKSGSLPARPGVVDVLIGAQREEDVTVEGNGGFLAAEQVGSLWGALATVGPPNFLSSPQPPVDETTGFWLVFGLQEGRSLQLFFTPSPGPGSLTDSTGSERYSVSPALLSVLISIQPTPRPLGDVHSPGSKAWWLIMVGGGIVCLGAAVWLSRHPIRLPFEAKS